MAERRGIEPSMAASFSTRRSIGGMLAIIMGPVVGANIHRVDARVVATFGFIVFSLFAFLSAGFSTDVDFMTLALTRLVMGVGISCFFLPLITIALSGLPPARIAAASGITNFMRNLGAGFGTAILNSLWDNKAAMHHARLVENVNSASPNTDAALAQLQLLGITGDAALAYLDRVVVQQSYMLATNAVLCIGGTGMLCLIAIVWWARPPFGSNAAAH